MSSMPFRAAGWVAAGFVAILATACSDSGDVTRVDVDATGTVAGVLFLDVDGGGTFDGGDTRLADQRVVLGTSAGGSVREATTDEDGEFVITEVPVGTYVARVPAAILGDSLQAGDPATVTVLQGETSTVQVDLTYPAFALEEIAGLATGRRVFTSGIALNRRLSFGDGRVHLRGAEEALRAVEVERVGFNTGDSIRVLGRTAIREGQPVLADVSVSVLVSLAAVPAPIVTTTAAAATAEGGEIDADLVRIRDARIVDTATVAGDFVVTVDDGSGPLEVLLQAFQSFNLTGLEPDPVLRVTQMTGLLVPFVEGDGSIRWRLVPRGGFDIATQVDQVDVGLTLARDFPVASENDTVTYTIVARNTGNSTATGVQVVDSLPPGFTLIDTEQTAGSFDDVAGRWDLGDLPPEAEDTLRVRSRIITELTGTFVNRARVLPLESEVDTNLGNNVVAIGVTVVEPEDKLADLRVRLESTRTDVTVGDEFDLVVTALNAGPLKVSAVQIQDSLPTGLELVSATPSEGDRSAAGVWTLDSIPVAGIETLTLRVRATDQAAASVTARAYSLGVQRENDPDPSNDSASVTIGVASAAPGRDH
ncbi:MAG TPA: hypothetical protein VJ925_14165 [Longimicrobiales bacterium]|nr:hypothetical protein [Longimicrobiales bacterium]